MSEMKGTLVTCDICKEQVFLKFLEEKETDGGYTHYCVYEDLPEDWCTNYGNIFGKDFSISHLCPECRKKMISALERKKEEIQISKFGCSMIPVEKA